MPVGPASPHRPLALVCLAAALCGASIPAAAGTMELAWDPVVHAELDGYRVFYGTQPGSYTSTVDVSAAQVGLAGLSDCTDYYVAVKGRAADGSLSAEFSPEISGWARPEVSAVQPSTLEPGSRVDVTIDGTNFSAGSTVLLDHPGLTVNGVTRSGCTRLVADVTVAAGASAAGVEIEVRGADQVYGLASGLLEVVADQGGDEDPPSVTSVQATSVSRTTATVVWTTDEPATSEVRFRPAGYGADQPPVTDGALTTQHAVLLEGLAPDTAYVFRVRSSDAAGNASPLSAQRGFTTPSSPYAYVRVEAETGSVAAPVSVVAGAQAFAGSWISTPEGTPNGSPDTPSGTSDYSFHLPASGSWYFWYRLFAPDASSESWYAAVDGESLVTLRVGDPVGAWVWVEGRSYGLSAGLHDLRLGGRRSGTRLDRVLVTNDAAFRPTEAPDVDRTPPAPVSGLSAVSQDRAAALSWTDPGSADLERVSVRYRLDGAFPQGPYDGFPLFDGPADPGGAEQIVHSGLTNGVTVRYTVFALDARGNASDGATVQVTPHASVELPPQVQNLRRADRR
jgi:hypothetical protein